jgi:hypothetical protein
MGEELDAQAAEVVVEAEPVRPLPARSLPRSIEVWGREVGPVALAATAGAAAGVVVVAAAHGSRAARRSPRGRILGRRRERIVGSRSFLIDVHVLGR